MNNAITLIFILILNDFAIYCAYLVLTRASDTRYRSRARAQNHRLARARNSQKQIETRILNLEARGHREPLKGNHSTPNPFDNMENRYAEQMREVVAVNDVPVEVKS